jgi:hypothetical protein
VIQAWQVGHLRTVECEEKWDVILRRREYVFSGDAFGWLLTREVEMTNSMAVCERAREEDGLLEKVG